MKILLGDLNAKVIREGIFKPTIGNENLHQIRNEDELRVIKLCHIQKSVKRAMFPHCNIHKFTWPPPDGKTHHQIDHILIDRRWHSSVLNV
jgi:hypothetical protein